MYVVLSRGGDYHGEFVDRDDAQWYADADIAPGAGYTIVHTSLHQAASGILADLAMLDHGGIYEGKDNDRERLNTALTCLTGGTQEEEVDPRDVEQDWAEALIEDDEWESVYHGMY